MSKPPRSTINFDTGIGADDEAADPGFDFAIAALQKDKEERAKAQVQAAPIPPPPSPPPAPAPPPAPRVRAAHRQVHAQSPAPDVYRAANPSLPSILFTTIEHLPSQGKAYPPGATVRYRPYTLGEAVYTEQSKMSLRDAYMFILQGLQCSFDPMQLTLPDTLYLGLVRKIASLGDSKVSITTTCPYCTGLNRTGIESTKLDFDDLQVPKLPIRLQLTIGEHCFMPMTLERYLALADLDLLEDFPALMAAQCTTMGDDLPAAIETVRNLTDARDIRLLRRVDELLHHELKPVSITCPQTLKPANEEADESAQMCGKAYPVSLDDVSATFVLPFSGWDENALDDQVSFG